MRRGSQFVAFTMAVTLAGCLGWEGQSGKSAISPPGLALNDRQPACRSIVRGTLWPPPDEPTFVVARQRVTIERADGALAEVETDKRGRFELRTEQAGRYAVTYATATHHGTARVKIDACSTYGVDLLARRL